MFTKIRTLPLRTAVKVQSEVVHAAGRSSGETLADLRTARGRTEATIGAFLGFMALGVSHAFAAEKDLGGTQDDAQGVVDLITTFTNFLIIVLAAGSLLMGIFAALQFVGSGGNSQVADRAKKTIKNVVIGLIIAAGIFLLQKAVLQVVGGVDDSDSGQNVRDKLIEGGDTIQ